MKRLVASLLVSAALVSGCSPAKGPEYASSAESPSYAEQFPAALAASRTRFTEEERAVDEASAKMASFPGELTDPDWTHVAAVVERADAAGHSADFVAAREDVDTVNRFYADEREKIRRKVSGAVSYAASQKGCDPDVAGAVGGSLDKAIELQTQEWLRERNPAHRYIDDHEDALGKKNVEKLREQADRIASASHSARVRLPATKAELDAKLSDAADVKSTLEAERPQQQAILDDPKASKGAKDRAKERLAAADKALASIDQEVSQAEAMSAEVEQRAKTALDRYEQALAALNDAIAKEAEKKAK